MSAGSSARRNYCHHNFAAGRRRENSSIAFGKVAVGNELLGTAFFPGMMPFVITKGQAGFRIESEVLPGKR